MKQSFLYIELAGGLGNQVFIYQMANFLNSLGKRTTILNTHHIDKNHSNGDSTIEDFELNSEYRITKFFPFFNFIIDRLKPYFKYLNKLNQNIILVLSDTDESLDPRKIANLVVSRNPKYLFVYGFWQNFEFWEPTQVLPIKNKCPKAQALLNKLALDNAIIFHYRLSTKNENWEDAWGVISPKYLIDSLDKIKLLWNLNFRKIWIFSNNIGLARDLISHLTSASNFDFEFIDDSGLRPAEIMNIISGGKYLICTNSTFSVAAAKIGDVKHVCVPLNFSKYKTVNFSFPNNWLKVENSWLY